MAISVSDPLARFANLGWEECKRYVRTLPYMEVLHLARDVDSNPNPSAIRLAAAGEVVRRDRKHVGYG